MKLMIRPQVIDPPTASYHATALVRVVLSMEHFAQSVEYGISPDGQLRQHAKRIIGLSALGILYVLPAAGALYAVLFLAGIVLAIAGVILAIAKTLLAAVLCLLGTWLAVQILHAVIQEEHHRRKRRR